MPAFTDKVTCSCLMARGILNLDASLVEKELLKINVDYSAMTKQEFRSYYKAATNHVVRSLDAYQQLSDSEKAAFDAMLEKRCGGCGVNQLPRVAAAQQQLLEVA